MTIQIQKWWLNNGIIIGVVSHQLLYKEELINIQGRIIKVFSDRYKVNTETGDIDCTARGIFKLTNSKPLVGDMVEDGTSGRHDRHSFRFWICFHYSTDTLKCQATKG